MYPSFIRSVLMLSHLPYHHELLLEQHSEIPRDTLSNSVHTTTEPKGAVESEGHRKIMTKDEDTGGGR